MRYLTTFALLITTFFTLSAQILEPVKWDMSSEALGSDEFLLTFKANIDPGWSIYSQHTSDEGPVPTSFYFDEGDHYTRLGAVEEKGKKKEGPDELFGGVTVIKFPNGPVYFTQKVKANSYDKPITGYFEFMTCDDERCLPPTEIDFNFQLSPATDNASGATEAAPATTAPTEKAKQTIAADSRATTSAAATKVEPTATQPVPGTTPPVANASAKEVKSVGENLLQPVLWALEVNQLDDNLYDLTFTANMEEGWAIYSQFTGEGGPVPTAFYFDGEGYERLGKVEEEGEAVEGPDPNFGGINVIKFKHGPVDFTHQLKRINTDKITGAIEFMCCDDSKCLPPSEVPFTIQFNPLSVQIGEAPAVATTQAPPVASDDNPYPLAKSTVDQEPAGLCGSEAQIEEGKSLWSIFGLGFFGGLLALLTPCVFPMIPLTVSFFTKTATSRSKGIRDAVLYGSFIFLVYLLLSIPFHLMDSIDPDILNKISTNVPLNIFFFVIFIVFAISFFGYFELTVPDSWTNKASQAEGSGGLVGIFFMALTLALVSFSCTGPILGSLLVGALSSDGGATQLTAGMGGFGMALALPFALFAGFPGMMKALPKSGGWLNSVKVVLGFAELALALKFLSNADLVDHWDFLKIELFLVLWILIGIGMALYLLGKIKFPHDSPLQKISLTRWGLALVTLAFVGYLFTGFQVDETKGSYKPLGMLSGVVPPVCYSYFRPCDCPQQLDCYKDLESGLAYARENNKPVMLDFTGYACQNCRRMEENVWPQKEVYSYLKDDYVVISLYVDDKKELAKPMQVTTVSGRQRELDEVGEKWAHFQQVYFNQNSQPQYILMSPNGRRLNAPVNYTPDVDEYAEFLRCGLENFRKLQQLSER